MPKSDLPFDLDEAIAHIKAGKPLNGKDGLLTPLIKQLTETALQAEQEQHITSDPTPNRKSGTTSKTIKTAAGNFELNTPRDRAGTFEPHIIKKHPTHLTDNLERKILALYSHRNSYQSIREHLKDYYDIEFSNRTLNAVTDKLLPELQAWRSKWESLSVYFKYPEDVRKAIYTTNAVEAVHRQFRRLTKTKGGFANENS